VRHTPGMGGADPIPAPGHPLVREWIRRHPGVRFGQQADEPAVGRLAGDLGLGRVERDLGGEDNLTVLVDQGRHVMRTYKPFVSRSRVTDLQRLRGSLRAAGLITPVPIELAGDSVHRCDWRWAEVEPYLQLPPVGQPVNADSRLFRGLGQLHRVMATLPDIETTDLRLSFVAVETLQTWVRLNVEAGMMTADRAVEISALLDAVRRRWVKPDSLPTQMIHTDPHAGNIMPTHDGQFIYLDIGAEVAPRVHDVAIALAYQLAEPGTDLDEVAKMLPQWLEAYEDGARDRLAGAEREALPVYAAAVTLYYDICGWAQGWRALGRRLLDLPPLPG
jgi:Ser/Thr protein kinase RdoA (MazF antagonist)